MVKSVQWVNLKNIMINWIPNNHFRLNQKFLEL